MTRSSRGAVRKLALARLISGTGTGIGATALAYFIYDSTGSALWLSAMFLLTFGLNGLLTPVAGLLADRLDRRRVMIGSDVLGGLIWAALVPLDDSLALVLLVFAASVIALPFGLAAAAAVPNLVSEGDLGWANGLMSAAGSVAQIAGPAVGGALYLAGSQQLAFAVNAFSFGASALLVISLRRWKLQEPIARETDRGGILAGFRVIRGDRLLLSLTAAWSIMFLAMDVSLVADPPLAAEFGVGVFGLGLIDTFWGAGAVAGGLIAYRAIGSKEHRWIALGMLGAALAWVVIGTAQSFVVVLAANVAGACVDAVGNVAGFGVLQKRSADAVRARVIGSVLTAGYAANALGFLLVGPLVEVAGPRAVFVTGGVLSLLATLVFVVPTRRYPN